MPVDVELELSGGLVADADRPRAPVAGERELALRRTRAAVQPVQDAQLGVRELRGVEQPPEEGASLRRAAHAQKGVERKRAVANPAVAVVPVADARERLGQRGGPGGGNRPGGSVDQELERERAPHHRPSPRALVAALGRPAAPEVHRGREARLDLAPGREDERLPVRRGEHDQRLTSVRGAEAPAGRVGAFRALSGPPGADRHGVGACARHGHAEAAPHARAPTRVAEAWLNRPAEGHLTRDSPLAGRAHAPGKPGVREEQRIRDLRAAARGRERRLEHVRLRQVAAVRPEGRLRGEREAAASTGVKERAEDARRVEVRQAEPVDRPVAGDKRQGAPVADHAVVLDRGIAVAARRRARAQVDRSASALARGHASRRSGRPAGQESPPDARSTPASGSSLDPMQSSSSS